MQSALALALLAPGLYRSTYRFRSVVFLELCSEEDQILRIAIVTPFPVKTEPARGAAIYQQVLEMTNHADCQVYVPHPVYPRINMLQPRTFLYQRNAAEYATPGIAVQTVDYPALPIVSRPFNGWSLSNALLPLFRRNLPDVVLSYCIYPDACGAVLAAKRLGKPAVVGSLGSDLRRISDIFCKTMVRYTLRNANFVIGVSRELIDRAKTLGASPERTRIIPTGCDSSIFFPSSREAARRDLGIVSSIPVVLFTGRLVPLKGLPELLQALSNLRDNFPSVVLACAGDGPKRSEYLQLAESLGIGSRVQFLGNIAPKDVARWLAACDLFCLPSHSEGSPISIMEALACGRPVVSTKVGGIPDLVDNRSGILVTPGDVAALTNALAAALKRHWDANEVFEHTRRIRRSLADIGRETLDLCDYVRRTHGFQSSSV